jgi:glycolate oxidase
MNRIELLDRDNLVAVVEPGVINWDLKQAAGAVGLFYPPDPGSTKVCTLGGNIAENAGGPYGTKYGVTGDYVLGLEAVLATGEVINTGSMARRDVAGYDLTSLIVGSEGTLAIVTKIILRLIPKPPARKAAFFAYDDFNGAVDAVQAIIDTGSVAAALEILDRTTLECLEQFLPGRIPVAAAMLLLEVDGERYCIEEQYARVSEAAESTGGRVVMSAGDEAGCEELWDIRRAVSPALGRRAISKVGEDVSVPLGQIGAMHARIQEISREYGLDIAVFGHAGDGNLHPNILTDRRDEEKMKRTNDAIGELFKAAVEMGGTLSGEHGIGTAKSSYMGMLRDEPTMDLMKRVKTLFDPDNILNPGKILPK